MLRSTSEPLSTTDSCPEKSDDVKVVTTANADETTQLGRDFGKTLPDGAIVCLSGPLGAGKTVFTRGIAEACGVTDEITSPTYTLVHEYRGTRRFYHIDLYRVTDKRDFDNLALDDMIFSHAITVIEWGEHASPDVQMVAYAVTIDVLDDGARSIALRDAP